MAPLARVVMRGLGVRSSETELSLLVRLSKARHSGTQSPSMAPLTASLGIQRSGEGSMAMRQRGGSSSDMAVRCSSSQAATETAVEPKDGSRRASAAGPPPVPSQAESKSQSRPQSQMIDVNPPRGTRDFAPEDMRLRTWLFSNFRKVGHILHLALLQLLTCRVLPAPGSSPTSAG